MDRDPRRTVSWTVQRDLYQWTSNRATGTIAIQANNGLDTTTRWHFDGNRVCRVLVSNISRLDYAAAGKTLTSLVSVIGHHRMVSPEDLFMRVCGRASYDAWEYLKKLRSHPNFPDLLRHLDELRGTLLKTHVEQTFQRVVSRNEQRRSSRRSLPVRRFHYGYPPPQERRAVAERRTAEDRRYH